MARRPRRGLLVLSAAAASGVVRVHADHMATERLPLGSPTSAHLPRCSRARRSVATSRLSPHTRRDLPTPRRRRLLTLQALASVPITPRACPNTRAPPPPDNRLYAIQ